jgi:SAM-dependent methyltransferase
MDDTIAFYSANAERLSRVYEGIPSEKAHRTWLEFVPTERSRILDIGAGTGRDAAWFAGQGHEVVAVEPADGFRELAQKLHPSPAVQWLDDSLPELEHVCGLGRQYDLILLSAVWMHVAPSDRERAFGQLAGLLGPGGRLILSLRYGPSPDERVMHSVSVAEVRRLADPLALDVALEEANSDQLGRPEVSWVTLVLRAPGGGTGTSPLPWRAGG